MFTNISMILLNSGIFIKLSSNDLIFNAPLALNGYAMSTLFQIEVNKHSTQPNREVKMHENSL